MTHTNSTANGRDAGRDAGNGNMPDASVAHRHPLTALPDSSIQGESGQVVQRRPPRRTGRGRPGENALMVAHRSLSLVILTRAYLDDLKVRGYRPKTIRGYELKLRRFTRWAESVGATQLQHLSVPLAKDYIAYLQTQRRWMTHPYPKRKPQPLLSPVAIRNYVRDLKTFAAWLADERYTATHLLASLRNPKADETPIEPFSDEEIQRIFAVLDPTDVYGIRDYVLLHTLWDTGLRVGELVALTLDDVDLAHGEIRVVHAKFGKWRDVGFGKQTHKFLTRYLAMGRPTPVFEHDRHFFLSLDGYPLTEGTVQRLCTRLSCKTGIHIHCHRFRHTFAVNMLRNGTDIRTLQKLMGHASVQILTRYLNLANADAVATHQNNSPADRFYAHRTGNVKRLPVRRHPYPNVDPHDALTL